MKTVILAENSLDSSTWEEFETEDIREFITERYATFPPNARIYNGNVSTATDVTPFDEAGVERLSELEGPFYVVLYPGEPITIFYAVLVVALAAVAYTLSKLPPNPTLRNNQNPSPNNGLSERSNRPRVGARIPDIFGTVRSTPDLLALPYKLFINHQEVEYSYMCIGRGTYDVSDIRDDTTLVRTIAGTSVEVYGPNTSPNSGIPQLRIGTAIGEPVLNVGRVGSVNGQVLRAPNDQSIIGNSNIRFVNPNVIELAPSETELNFTKKFVAGDALTISGSGSLAGTTAQTRTIQAFNDGSFRFQSATIPAGLAVGQPLELSGALFTKIDADGWVTNAYDLSGVYTIGSVALEGSSPTYCRVGLSDAIMLNPQWNNADGISTQSVAIIVNGVEVVTLLNLDGTYTVLSVSESTILLDDPASINPEWNSITTTAYLSPTLSTTGPKWIGPFEIDSVDTNRMFSNFVALNGLYKDDGKNSFDFDVTVEMETTRIDENGDFVGVAEAFQITIEGSGDVKSTRAATLRATPAVGGRLSVRARRITPSDLEFEGNVVDEIKWRDLYSVVDVDKPHFGDVTTVQSIAYATEGALAVKERKLNLLVTRKIPLRGLGSDFSTALYATNDAAEILSFAALDEKIGNRQKTEIDFDAIYGAIAEVKTYFGTDEAAEFSYTFDTDNLSFEETARAIADAAFCIVYRQGNILKLNFERANEDSSLLFNHRNKLPGSEKRSVRFGRQGENDGINYEYVSPTDDAIVTLYLPADRSAINPKNVESLGVRSRLQAYFHANRMYNKLRFQNKSVEFQATQEADLIINQDRILVADNTRPNTIDGEVIEQNGLELVLSQKIDFTNLVQPYIFLQLFDGTIESIAIIPGGDLNRVILAVAPRLPLALDPDLYARTTFYIVGSSERGQNAFLVTERKPQNNFTSTVTAINYDARYYANDADYLNGIVNSASLLKSEF